MSRVRRAWPLAILAVFAFLPLWRTAFLGEAIGPFDQIRAIAPWNGPKPDGPWDVLQADGVLQFYSWRSLVLESWGKGQLPMWNPYELGGTPLLANSQSGALYPPHVLLGLLHVPVAPATTLLAWFHLFLAAAGVSASVQLLGGSKVGGVFAGGSFALSPFLLGWTALPSVISTVAWIPWLLVGVLSGWIGRPRCWALVALGTMMMLLAGHLQFAAYGLLAAGLVAVLAPVAWKNCGWRPFAYAAVGLAVGAGAAWPQLGPVLAYSKLSHRMAAPTEQGFEAYRSLALQPFELANLPSPSVLGDPHTAAPQEFALPSAYWPIVIKPGANLAESAVTLGPLVLALMFLLPWRDRRSWPVIALALISILLALGTPLNRLLYFGLPGWSSTGSPARVLALFVMSACVLAGFALSHVFATRAGKGGRSQILPLLPAILAVVSVLLERTAPVPERLRVGVDQLIVAAHSTAVPGLVITSAIGGVLLLLARRGPSRQALVFAIIAPALLAGFFVFALVPTGQPLAQVAGPPDLARIAVFNERWSLYRTPAALLPPNTASLSHIHELGGYDSLLNRNTVAELRQIDGRDPAPPENGNMMLIKPGATVQGLASAGVTETWALGLNGIERRPVAGPGRVACPAGDAKIIEEGADRLRVSASGPGNLVIKDNLAGCDWVGTLDGQTVLLRDGSRVEIALPPGRHELALKSRWPGWLAACWSLGLALLLVALAAKPGTPEPERPDTMSSELDNEPNRSRT